MKAKKIITVVLLAFVVASVAYLVIKESGGISSAPARPDTNEQTTVTEEEPQIPGASEKKITNFKVVAYYFHGNMRCMTCRTIEAYAKEAIQAGFPEALKDGRLEFRVVNVDEPGNEHFVQDYQLVTRSVVIAEFEGDKQKQWKNLQQVWELVRNKQAFLKYIQDQTGSYLEVPN